MTTKTAEIAGLQRAAIATFATIVQPTAGRVADVAVVAADLKPVTSAFDMTSISAFLLWCGKRKLPYDL